MITPQHNVEVGYGFEIKFPTTFAVIQNSACTVTGLGIKVTCTADAPNNRIILGQVTENVRPGGEQIIFVVNSIQNPGIYESPGEIKISMLTSFGGEIDLGSYVMKANLYNSTYISKFEVTAGDTMAGASDVTYFFKVVPK